MNGNGSRVLRCSVLQCVAVCRSVSQCVAVCRSMFHCFAAQCPLQSDSDSDSLSDSLSDAGASPVIFRGYIPRR